MKTMNLSKWTFKPIRSCNGDYYFIATPPSDKSSYEYFLILRDYILNLDKVFKIPYKNFEINVYGISYTTFNTIECYGVLPLTNPPPTTL